LPQKSYFLFKEREATNDQQQTTIFNTKQFQLFEVTMAMLIDSSFLNQVYTTPPIDSLVFNIKHCSNYDCNKFKFVDNLLYFEEYLYILKGSICLSILKTYNDF